MKSEDSLCIQRTPKAHALWKAQKKKAGVVSLDWIDPISAENDLSETQSGLTAKNLCAFQAKKES
jgi:hypothetical protein